MWAEHEKALRAYAEAAQREVPILAKKAELYEDQHDVFDAWLELSKTRQRVVTPAGTIAMPITVGEVEAWCRLRRREWRAGEVWDGCLVLDDTLREVLSKKRGAKEE